MYLFVIENKVYFINNLIYGKYVEFICNYIFFLFWNKLFLFYKVWIDGMCMLYCVGCCYVCYDVM